MNHIVVKSSTINVKKIERAGKPTLLFNEQSAAIDNGGDFPKPFKFSLAHGENAYPPGRYLLDVASLDVGDFDSLVMGRNLKLVPIPDAPVPAAPTTTTASK